MELFSDNMKEGVDDSLLNYLFEEVIPQYNNFDEAHKINHVTQVIKNSMEYMEYFNVKKDMVLVVAIYHDLGLIVDRENHHIHSGKIIRSDKKLKEYFTEKELEAMAMAVEDHRASNKTRPRNDYGLIVSEADRDLYYKNIITRTIQYGLANYKECSYNEHKKRIFSHLYGKYGNNGYMSLWLDFGSNIEKLKTLRKVIYDKIELEKVFLEIFNSITGE